MLKNYLKIAFRNLIKNKSHTLINLSGLTLGITCAIVVFLVIQFDLSFDTWHANNDRVYRVVRLDTEFGAEDYNRGGPYPMAEALRNDMTGVETAVLIHNNFSTPVFTSPEEGTADKFTESSVALVDPDYFQLFDYTWLAGNEATAIDQPNSVVITKSFAERLFGSVDVIGNSITMNVGRMIDLQVTGVVTDPPVNSDFPFQVLLSLMSASRDGDTFESTSWGSQSTAYQTYVLLEPGVKAEEINAQFDDLITKYRDEERAAVLEYFLQPLSTIHFDSRFDTYNNRVIEKSALWTLGIIGFLLVLAACINFINLNTALAVRRSKEVGLRKTLGGTKNQLIIHFLIETGIITFLSMLIAIGTTEIALRFLEPVFGFELQLNLIQNPMLLLFLIGIFLVTTLMAGFYPAYYLARFSPMEAIRNTLNASFNSGLSLRRGLIISQFTITQALVICTVIISTQTRFFQNRNLGYNRDSILEINIAMDDKQVLDPFKQELLSQSAIRSVTFSNSGSTSGSIWGGNYFFIEDTTRVEGGAQIKFGDEDYVSTYELQLLAGSNYRASDTTNAYIVNESFAKEVGYTDAYNEILGKEIEFWGNTAPVVGVVKDFNTQSLHADLSPVLIAAERNYRVASIKISAGQTSEAITLIEGAFNKYFPSYVFDYLFLDERIQNLYEDEQRTEHIMNIFTFIAIAIGALGLIGLVSYMANTKTKEIGVRKVLGASVGSILTIFGKEIIILTSISFFIAAPIAWYAMNGWLSNFAYKIPLGPSVFILAFAGTISLALLTIAHRAIRAAFTNPITSLKTE
ncbi:MAG: ABC transporter permease [Bacteroidota bacterium]